MKWMPLDLTDDKSTLVQVMAWCHQTTSHYLSQCWPRSLWPYGVTRPQWFNSSPPGQTGHHFSDYNFNRIFLNENDTIPIQISLKYVPRSPTDNKPALVQVMAWRRTGDKPLLGPTMTHFIDTYGTMGRWVKGRHLFKVVRYDQQ